MLTPNQESWAKRKFRANRARRDAYAAKTLEARTAKLRAREERLAAEEAPRARIDEARAGRPGSVIRAEIRGPAKAFLREIKRRPCVDCGQYFPPEAMDFDHRDPSQKTECVSKVVKVGVAAVAREAAKCDLVCACCHRIRTARRRSGLPATLPPSDYEI